jgi:hypothetical protein
MKKFLLAMGVLFSVEAAASCEVAGLSSPVADALGSFLQKHDRCPRDVRELRAGLIQAGFQLAVTQVSNRGFHNPGMGSFSLFELATRSGVAELGDFFFGHFTEVSPQGLLQLQQEPRRGALMIEAIAWDAHARVFHFYELIGQGGGRSKWFFRGSSQDIQADLEKLHLPRQPGEPAFGFRLRCSGCHLAGGPILKELAAPHNDWWTEARGLPTAHRPNTELAEILRQRVGPEVLAQAVQAGMAKLLEAQDIATNPRIAMKPLFCPMELNLESDLLPLDGPAAKLQVPSALFVDPMLAQADLLQAKEAYLHALENLGLLFPETRRKDADHAWLGPVKAASDQASIRKLVVSGLIDDEFVADVLAIDMAMPFFSSERCSLLQFLPQQFSPNWKKEFVQRLQAQATDAASTLASHLTRLEYNRAFHQARASKRLAEIAERLRDFSQADALLLDLQDKRASIQASEISNNPRGQILEPGFRVIFPQQSL